MAKESTTYEHDEVARNTVDFSTALIDLKYGLRVARKCWDRGTFIFRQVPNLVPAEVIPNMKSLPASVKEEFQKRIDVGWGGLENEGGLAYDNQIALVSGATDISGWSFNVYDIFADDWILLDSRK